MNKFEKILLTLLFIEVFVGGGGRLIDFGVVSIRQVLFLLLFVVYVVRIVKLKAFFNKEINTFYRFTPVTIGIYLIIGWFAVSAILGFINGHPLSIIVMDFFRVSYFILYFPLAYYISSQRFTVKRIITLLKGSALAVALFTITISLLGKTIFGGEDFKPFYDFMNWIMNDDLFFRPSNSVFYKSHLFVVIGLVLSLNSVLNKKYTKVDIANLIFCSTSAVWSETRGFLLAFMISVLMIIILDTKVMTDPVKGIQQKFKKLAQSKMYLKKLVILILVFISVPFSYQYMTLERFQEEPIPVTPDVVEEPAGEEINDISVNARIDFIIASKDILLSSPAVFVFGTGYGMEIDGRLNGIEMSFLDILVEQGLIGLFIWFYLFFLVFYNYYYIYKRGEKLNTLDISIMSAFMGLLLLTNINPFINNPIGISFFLIALIISQNRKEQFLMSRGRE
ncbi:O-antigen ligase family protein [Litchfieldia salsa]|uniref:O-antigen ligase-related domain-containing protein n=1 Tax=Litchfieldia salsa TaxID=930152 RepID=A0A1H0WXJ6_9BACI|nr:O-antigen ligase family protein [Litchfieldia salsa]SDP94946.1 hypothetical protein SAMN05216565_11736 [Litchfieldia salsa]